MPQKIRLCIQTQKGFYILSRNRFSRNLFKSQQIIPLNVKERDRWIEKMTPKETFIADRISFVMKEILKLSQSSFLIENLSLLPHYLDGTLINIYSNEGDGDI